MDDRYRRRRGGMTSGQISQSQQSRRQAAYCVVSTSLLPTTASDEAGVEFIVIHERELRGGGGKAERMRTRHGGSGKEERRAKQTQMQSHSSVMTSSLQDQPMGRDRRDIQRCL